MDRRQFSRTALGAAVTGLAGLSGLAGCGGSGGNPGAPAAAGSGTPPALAPLSPSASPVVKAALRAGTVFTQTVPAADGGLEAAPGQANYWDLTRSFALEDGFDNQWDGALQLKTFDGQTQEQFPFDQTFAELTASGPTLTEADGVRSVTIVGTRHALLHPVPGARLRQTLDLRQAVAPVVLDWTGSYYAGPYNFTDEPYFWQVVVRSLQTGEVLATLYRDSAAGFVGNYRTARLDAFVGQGIELSFEQSNPANGTRIETVSARDANGTQFVVNGDFSAGLTGWTAPIPEVLQNVQSGMRMLHGLEVRRAFYTQPNVLWGRFTDSFTNPTASPISLTVQYVSILGSNGAGIIYGTPGATSRALTSWDGAAKGRDVGLVYGDGASVTYQSASALATADGSRDILVNYPITVPAGGTVAIAQFLIMTGVDTGRGAADASARATQVELLAADIANQFRTASIYQRGLTQAQLAAIVNL
jgi:hypothetical protein